MQILRVGRLAKTVGFEKTELAGYAVLGCLMCCFFLSGLAYVDQLINLNFRH